MAPAIAPFLDKGPYEIDEIDDFVQQHIERSFKTPQVSFQNTKKFLEETFQNELTELDSRILQRIWATRILKQWVTVANSVFQEKFEKRPDVIEIQKILNDLQVINFWENKILMGNPLQKVLDESKHLLTEKKWKVALEEHKKDCFAKLFELNRSIQTEIEFLEEFTRIIEEDAIEKFLDTFRSIFHSTLDTNSRFLLVLEQCQTAEQEHLKSLANKLKKEKYFYFSKEFFDVVKPFLEPVIVSKMERNGLTILKVQGATFPLRQYISRINQKDFDELHLIACLSLRLDENLELPGTNVFIKTKKLLVPSEVKIVTSGEHNNSQQYSDAGKTTSGDGRDGNDGYAGQSGGNILIKAAHIDHPKNLNVVADGGNGSCGQNGGPGSDGTNGVGLSQSELKAYPPPAAWFLGERSPLVRKVIDKIDENLEKVLAAWWTGDDAETVQGVWENIKHRKAAKSADRGAFLYVGKVTEYQNHQIYVRAELKNKMIVTFGWECGSHSRWVNCQSYLHVQGSEGKQGGLGGLGGQGGEGGMAGTITINDETGSGAPGNRGAEGKRGKNGMNGKNGWDMAWQDYSMDSTVYLGKESMRLKIKYHLSEKTGTRDSNKRISCPYRKHQEFEDSMIQMVYSELEHPKQRETVKQQEKKKSAQNQARAIRKSEIQADLSRDEFSDSMAKVNQIVASLRSNHSAVKIQNLIQRGIKLQQQQQTNKKAEMNVMRQVEFKNKRKKEKIAKWPPLKPLQKQPTKRGKRSTFLQKLYEIAERIEWSEANFDKMCPKSSLEFKCEDSFLRHVPEIEWSHAFRTFQQFFQGNKNLLKEYETLKKTDIIGARMVIRQFILGSTKEEDEIGLITRGINTIKWLFGFHVEDRASLWKQINESQLEYEKWLQKKDNGEIVFDETLARIDEQCELNNEMMEKMKKTLKEKPSLRFKCHLELFARKHRLNIRVFVKNVKEQMELVESFNPFSASMLYITIDEELIVRQLQHKMALFNLERDRFQKSLVYKETLRSLMSFSTSKELENYWKRRHFHQEILQGNQKEDNHFLSVEKCMATLRNALHEMKEFPWSRLVFLTEPYIGTNQIIEILGDRLCSEGCLISSTEICFVINAVLRLNQVSVSFLDLTKWILVSRKQQNWLTEFAIFEIENYFERRLVQNNLDKLRSVDDKQVLLLLVEQLQQSNSNEHPFEILDQICTLLQKATTTTLLLGLDLQQWPLVLKIDYWKSRLNGLAKWRNEGDLHRVLHYLLSVETIYKETAVSNMLGVLESKSKDINANLITKLFQALYSEQCFLNEPFIDTLKTQEPKGWLLNLEVDSFEVRTLPKLLNIIKNVTKGIKDKVPFLESIITESDKLSEKFQTYDQEAIKKWSVEHQKTKIFYNNMPSLVANGTQFVKALWEDPKSALSFDGNPKDWIENTIVKASLAEELAIINRAIFLWSENRNRIEKEKAKKGFFLRNTQKIAILLFCLEEQKHSRILEQVSTGEGKSLIVASLAIIRALQGEKVDVITSSSVLARRDAELNADLYGMFNISVGHNCSEALDERKEIYQTKDVIYGEITNYQRDYLIDHFYGVNILGGRKYENVIVDEVDSMLLDKGNNVLYLSHQLAGFDKLESVFLYIWQLVNRPVKDQEEYEFVLDTDRLRENVLDNLSKRIAKKDIELIEPSFSTSQIECLWNQLIRTKIIDSKGQLLINEIDVTQFSGLQNIEPKTKNRLIYLLDEALRKQCMATVPNFLIPFVEVHLTKWIENAKMALCMLAGNDYVVDVDRTGLKSDLDANITILDRDTGTDQASSQWEEGLHQFLQLKHGCKMSLMSLKAIFISNVTYFTLYKNLFGLTGTLGSVSEMELLQKIHNVEYVTIPTASGKKFNEEMPIVCRDQREWMEKIIVEVKKFSEKRSILIICETIEKVDLIQKNLEKAGIVSSFAYRREHEKFSMADRLLEPGKVIAATNLAGRGTDIQISDSLQKAGGLHICLSFLPQNKRVEEQAFGRSARSGDPGSGRMIVVQESDAVFSTYQMLQLKMERDSEEIKRVQEIKEHYELRILAEESCFREFRKVYNECERKFDWDSTRKRIHLENLIDQWALWLDRYKSIIKNDESAVEYKKQLTAFVKRGKNLTGRSEFTLMPHSIKLAKEQIKEKHFKSAITQLNEIIKGEPLFSEAAHYYKAYAIAKMHKWEGKRPFLKEFVAEMKKAKAMFETHSDNQLQYAAIVNKMREGFENTGFIQINSYEAQKQAIVRMYNHYIGSINDSLGAAITPSSFERGMIEEGMSTKIYEDLLKNGVLISMRINDDFEISALKKICHENGVLESKMAAYLKQEKGGELNEIADRLQKHFSLPNRDEFWQSLVTQKWLLDCRTFVIVDENELLREYPNVFPREMMNSWKSEKFEKLAQNYIWKTPEQITNLVPSESVFMKDDFLKLQMLVPFDSLLRKGVITEVEAAVIPSSFIASNPTFSNYDKLDKQAFEAARIPIIDVNAIIDELLEKKMIAKVKDHYTLLVNPHSVTLSNNLRMYTTVTRCILLRNFAYRIAFNRILEQIKEKEWPIKISLIHKPHQSLLWDLIDAGILSNVAVGNIDSISSTLDKLYPEKASKFDLQQTIRRDVPGLTSGIEQMWELLQSHGHIKKTNGWFTEAYQIQDKQVAAIYTDQDLNLKLHTCLRGQMLLRTETTKRNIEGILTQLRGFINALEVPEPYYQWISASLSDEAIVLTEEINMFMMNGIGEVIRFKEQPYTWKMLRNTFVVILLGVAQIGIGALILLFSAGLMTNVGNGFISEGVGDIMFAMSALSTGHFSWANYRRHKIESIIFTVITCGIGAWYNRGAQVSHFGAKFAEKSYAVAGKSLHNVVGKELIKEAGWKLVAKKVFQEVSIQTIKGIAFGLTSYQVKAFVDNYLRSHCNNFASNMMSTIEERVEKHKISTTIDEVYRKLGTRDGMELIRAHIQNHLDEKHLKDGWSEAFTRYGTHVSRQVSDGFSRHGAGQSSLQGLVYATGIILKGVTIIQHLHDLKIMVDTLLDDVSKTLKNSSKMTTTNEVTYSNQHELENFRHSAIALIREQISLQAGQIIAKRFIEPVLQRGATMLVTFASRQIKKQYKSYRDQGHLNEFQKRKREYERKKEEAITVGDIDAQKAIDIEYHKTLNDLKMKVRSPKLYAEIVREGGHMDMLCLKGFASILDGKLAESQGYKIEVENENGATYTAECGNQQNAKCVYIKAIGEHFIAVDKNGAHVQMSNEGFDCLMEALGTQIPEINIKGRELRVAIANVIEKDPEIGWVIANGLHALSIKRGFYGGRMNENKQKTKWTKPDNIKDSSAKEDKIFGSWEDADAVEQLKTHQRKKIRFSAHGKTRMLSNS